MIHKTTKPRKRMNRTISKDNVNIHWQGEKIGYQFSLKLFQISLKGRGTEHITEIIQPLEG